MKIESYDYDNLKKFINAFKKSPLAAGFSNTVTIGLQENADAINVLNVMFVTKPGATIGDMVTFFVTPPYEDDSDDGGDDEQIWKLGDDLDEEGEEFFDINSLIASMMNKAAPRLTAKAA